MKRLLLFFLILSVAAFAFADGKGGTVAAEIETFFDKKADTAMGDLTFGEVEELLRRLSIPMQEAAYIQRSSSASMMLPGKGQFMNGDALSGALFLTADILVVAGTLVGTYFLLPEALQFGQLDYLNTSHTDIKAAWKGAAETTTFMQALPTLGVLTGGMLLHKGISIWSAKHAAKLARDNIDAGNITFEPRAMFMSSGKTRMGFGFGIAH